MASKGFEEARRRCIEAAATGDTHLNLRDLALETLPDEFQMCTNVKMLDLRGNLLRSLPTALYRLDCLESLSLDENPIRNVPAFLGDMTTLRRLSLISTELRELPATLGKLRSLETLLIGGSNLNDINVVGVIKSLKALCIRGLSEYCVLPDLSALSRLRDLELAWLNIKEVPSWVFRLPLLWRLALVKCGVRTVSPNIAKLTALTELDLSRNPLEDLPVELGALSHLKLLRIGGCRISGLPQAIVAQGGAAILVYLREKYESVIRQWVSKLIVVGEAGVGKTSLLHSLRKEKHNPSEPPTDGIMIRPLEMPHPTETGVTMNLKSWDFGGQQIYHATHQFFLTNRSIFILVWNVRVGHEQGRLFYWLDTIRARAPESPVLLVATHIDQHLADLPLADLQAKYPQLVAQYIVSNRTNVGIGALWEALRVEAAKLPLMGERWPRTWVEAADRIRAMSLVQTHIAPQTLWKTMQEEGVHQDGMRILATWLHELGEIIFFHDNPYLESIVLLDPEWATRAISRVLISPEVTEQCGIFTRDAMNKLWSDLEPHLRDYLLRLMEQFDLSYRTEDNQDISIVVERLPHDAPGDMTTKFARLLGNREVRMRFQIDGTLPAGIPTWFIARSHRFTTRTQFRRGALFADGPEQKHLAVVRASPEARSLELSVRGPAPHAFFTLLRDGLEVTLKRFPGLPVTRLIPCPGHEGLPCNHEFKYEALEGRLEKKRFHIECPEAAAGDVNDPMVDVREMLFGLTPATLDDVHRKLEESLANDREQKEMLRSLTAMMQRNHYLSFRALQRHEETHCPSLFVLRPESDKSWTQKLLGQSVELHLVCEQPGEAHLTGDSGRYKTKLQAEWLAAIAPYITKVAAILKYMAPLISATTGYASKALEEMFKADLKLMDALIGKLPAITLEEDAMALGSRYGDESLERVEGATLRMLRNLLDKLDKERKWGGLQKVLTMEGDYLWLCEKHAAKHRM